MRTFLLVFAAALATPGMARAGAVQVDVGNVTPGAGDVKVALCRSELVPETCERNTTLPASGAAVRAEFADVEPGRYAVAVYQDIDHTGQLRRGKLGIPLEPYAFSNGAGLTHMPKFEAAAFEVGPGLRRIGVSLRRPRRRDGADQ